MGLLINIESIDGGGKTTQGSLVKRLLSESGLSASLFAFPDRPSNCADESHPAHFSTGILIDRYLQPNLKSEYGERIEFIDLKDTFFRREWPWTNEDGLAQQFGLSVLPREVREQMVTVIREKMVQMLFSINRRERLGALRRVEDIFRLYHLKFDLR